MLQSRSISDWASLWHYCLWGHILFKTNHVFNYLCTDSFTHFFIYLKASLTQAVPRYKYTFQEIEQWKKKLIQLVYDPPSFKQE